MNESKHTSRALPRLGRLLAGLLGVALLFAADAGAALAQGGGGGGGDLGGVLDTLNSKLVEAASPLAGLALVVIGISLLAAPMARSWAEQNKALLGGIVGGLVLIYFNADIVNFISSFR
ncbi:MAG TPA: hypothetical protein VFS21_33975 [Roseiflexaceae bacterium]|nr:hypothetical protein [Roseiflexaceae bacterium]